VSLNERERREESKNGKKPKTKREEQQEDRFNNTKGPNHYVILYQSNIAIVVVFVTVVFKLYRRLGLPYEKSKLF
jgi:hypothetical protein